MSTVAAEVRAIEGVGTEVRGPTALGSDRRRVVAAIFRRPLTQVVLGSPGVEDLLKAFWTATAHPVGRLSAP